MPVPESKEQIKLSELANKLAPKLIFDSVYESVKLLYMPSVENVNVPNHLAELLLISYFSLPAVFASKPATYVVPPTDIPFAIPVSRFPKNKPVAASDPV